MPAQRLPNRRRQLIAPGLVLLATVLTIAWAGLGIRHGRHWYMWLFKHRPDGIIIHHSASTGYAEGGELLTAADIDAYHEKKGWEIEYEGQLYHIGYHYVILADGTVEPGRPEEVRGAHCTGYNDHLGICLTGNFSSKANSSGRDRPSRPTEAQVQALHDLARDLMVKYDFRAEDIHRHQDFGQTDCPGDRLDFDSLLASVAR